MSTLVLQPDATAGKDTYLEEAAPTTVQGTQTILVVGTTGKSVDAARSVLQFDISSIPAGSTITSAQLDFNVASVSGTGHPLACTMYRVRRSDWDEASATWNDYKTSTSWTTAGAGDTTNDIDTTNSHAFNGPSATGAFSIATGANFVALVQDALDSRSGIVRVLLRYNDDLTTGTANSYNLDSSDHATAGNRPKLTVDYTAPSGGTARAQVYVFD